MSIHNQRAFASGALFLVTALVFFIASLDYDPGRLARMGPGFFPRMLSICLGGIGILTILSSIRRKGPLERLEPWSFKLLTWIAGSVALFAFMLPRFGLVISLIALLVTASLAHPNSSWRGIIVNTFVLVAIAVGAFVYGVGLQLPLWPAFLP